MLDDLLTPAFRLSEFLDSQTAVRLAIDNTPPAQALANIRNILAPGMQRVRDLLRCPVQITSGYRSPPLNRAVGGAASSAHLLGLAADFRAPEFGVPRTVAQYLMQHGPDLRYDQLIFEGTWVHIAWPSLGDKARAEVLTAHFAGGPATYTAGIA